MSDKIVKILILEDMKERIEHFEKKLTHWGLQNNVEIIWKTNVDSFEGWIAGNKDTPPDMIIFDHDLDYEHYNDFAAREQGKEMKTSNDCSIPRNGADGAKLVEWTDIPVVIWSANKWGALSIANVLRDKGIQSVRMSFDTSTVNVVCKMVKAMIEDS